MPRGWPKGKPRGPQGSRLEFQSEPARLMLAWRLERGLTQRQAAAQLGCSNKYIGEIERGVMGISNKYREKMGLDLVIRRAWLAGRV